MVRPGGLQNGLLGDFPNSVVLGSYPVMGAFWGMFPMGCLSWVAKSDLLNAEVIDKALKASAVHENAYIES